MLTCYDSFFVIHYSNTLWAIIAIITGHEFHLIQWPGSMSVAIQRKISSLRWLTRFLSIQLSNQISARPSQPQHITHLLIQKRATNIPRWTLTAESNSVQMCVFFVCSFSCRKHTDTLLKRGMKGEEADAKNNQDDGSNALGSMFMGCSSSNTNMCVWQQMKKI